MRKPTILAIFCALLAPHLQAQTTRALSPDDFLVSGLHSALDSSEVRAALGAPDSVTVAAHPFDFGAELYTLHYPGLAVIFFPDAMQGFLLLSPAHATARGIRIGDSAEKAKQRYGPPHDRYETSWDYIDPQEPSELHVIRFTVVEGQLQSIFLGWLLD